MARTRKLLMAGAVVALVSTVGCSDRLVGPGSDAVFDPGAYVAEREQAYQPDGPFRELVGDDSGARSVPSRKVH